MVCGPALQLQLRDLGRLRPGLDQGADSAYDPAYILRPSANFIAAVSTLDVAAVAFLAKLFVPRATFFAVFFAGATARLPSDCVVDFLRAVFLAAINVHVPSKGAINTAPITGKFP